MSALVRVPSEISIPCFLSGERDVDPNHIIAAKNHLLYIPSVGDKIELVDHSPDWFSPTVLDYDFDLGASCPGWLAFLDQALSGDDDRIRLLAKWFGLLLTQDTSHQKLLLMVGPKRAGKGTVTRIMQYVIGPDNVTSPSLTSLGGNFGLWPLLDKSVAIMADAHIGNRADSVRVLETIKSITGEDAVNIDRKNLRPLLNVRLPIRFVITVNELPNLRDASGALSSRLSILPFTESFEGREDRGLEKRLIAECPGILAWSLRGLKMLREEGLHVPTASRSVVENFERLSSPIIGFMQDCCEVGVGFQVACSEIFAAWCEWAKKSGHKSSSSTRFGEQLRSAMPHIVRSRPRQGDARVYSYNSVRLNSYGQTLVEAARESARS
jgi:putative DNA primase/helicase